MPEKVRLDFWMADLRLVVSMAGLTTQSPGAECHPGSQMVLESKLFQAMDRMEKMLERIESRQQKADSETKSVYTTVSTGISYLRGQVRQLERNQQRQLLSLKKN
jgi:hypothetical protein